MGFGTIATGHNLDDALESLLMNMLRGSISHNARLSPSSGVLKSKKFTKRIKPLYFVSVDETLEYAKKKGFDLWYEKCPYSSGAHRREVRTIFKSLTKDQKTNILTWFIKHKKDLKS